MPPEIPLGKATWAEVRKANTDFLNKHSEYDFEGAGKYTAEKGYVSNGIGGAILKTDKDKLITKAQWQEARKKYLKRKK